MHTRINEVLHLMRKNIALKEVSSPAAYIGCERISMLVCYRTIPHPMRFVMTSSGTVHLVFFSFAPIPRQLGDHSPWGYKRPTNPWGGEGYFSSF